MPSVNNDSSDIRCNLCEEKVVYRRRYSGQALCASCFTKSIVEKTRRTISRYKLLERGDKIAVALSGGKDSSSLLHVLKKITADHGSELYAVTVDEGVAGYRDESRMLAEKMCTLLDIPQVVVSFDELFGFNLDAALSQKDRNFTSCTMCGTLRRRAIDLAAKKIDATVVATAHNLDDFLQTFLINMMNNDLQRTAWLNPLSFNGKNDGLRRVKPFMEIYEDEIAYYTYLSNIAFQVSDCPYKDESIRSEIRTFLNKLENDHPGIKLSTFKSAMNSAMNFSLNTNDLPRKERLACKNCGQLSSQPICSVCKTVRLVDTNMQIYGRDH